MKPVRYTDPLLYPESRDPLLNNCSAAAEVTARYYPNQDMKTRIATTLAVISAIALASATMRADLLAVVTSTNATWRAIGPVGNLEGTPIDSVGSVWESTNTGWNSSLFYQATAGTGWHAPTIDASGAHGDDPTLIWCDGPPALASTPAYFRTAFFVRGTPTSALLDCAVDDDAQIWINGELVLNDNNNTASTFQDIDVARYLRPGLNLLAVKAHDSYASAPLGMNYEALALRLDVEFTPDTLSIRCSQVEMCWQSATNVIYQLQYQSALTGGQWTNLGAPISGDGTRKCVTDAIAENEPHRFYRTVTAP